MLSGTANYNLLTEKITITWNPWTHSTCDPGECTIWLAASARQLCWRFLQDIALQHFLDSLWKGRPCNLPAMDVQHLQSKLCRRNTLARLLCKSILHPTVSCESVHQKRPRWVTRVSFRHGMQECLSTALLAQFVQEHARVSIIVLVARECCALEKAFSKSILQQIAHFTRHPDIW